MLIRMHTISRQWMSLLCYMHVNTHTWICTHPTHTHLDTDAQGNTQLCIHQNTSMPPHTSICQHPRIYPHTCVYAHILAHTSTYTHTQLHSRTSTYTHVCTNANTYTCIQNKNAFTDITNIHTQIHSYANTSPWTCVSTQNL